MAGAIAKALAGASPAREIRLTTGSSVPSWANGLAHVTHRAVASTPEANRDAVAGAEAVILGVKPYAIVDLAREIADALAPDALVVSVAGGVTVGALAAALPAGAAAVRTMPNTPVAIGRGITAYCVAEKAPADTGERVEALLAPTGAVMPMREELIDGFSAVVGSGPAYVYAIVESLTAAAVEQGLSPEDAARMVPGMIGGAIAYLEASGREPADLREEVTSPGGSTAAALAAFAEGGLDETLRGGVAAATARAREMGLG